MEKFQQNPLTKERKHSDTISACIASIALTACVSIPSRHETNHVPYHTPHKPFLINKTHTHNGPLGDKICTYIYNNKESILKLCEPKPSKIIREFSKIRPGETKYTPGKIEMTPRYGLKPDGKFGQTLVPKNTPPKYEKTPPKLILCSIIQPFNQTTGAALSQYESCHSTHTGRSH